MDTARPIACRKGEHIDIMFWKFAKQRAYVASDPAWYSLLKLPDVKSYLHRGALATEELIDVVDLAGASRP